MICPALSFSLILYVCERVSLIAGDRRSNSHRHVVQIEKREREKTKKEYRFNEHRRVYVIQARRSIKDKLSHFFLCSSLEQKWWYSSLEVFSMTNEISNEVILSFFSLTNFLFNILSIFSTENRTCTFLIVYRCNRINRFDKITDWSIWKACRCVFEWGERFVQFQRSNEQFILLIVSVQHLFIHIRFELSQPSNSTEILPDHAVTIQTTSNILFSFSFSFPSLALSSIFFCLLPFSFLFFSLFYSEHTHVFIELAVVSHS